jgi:hypothetical protein
MNETGQAVMGVVLLFCMKDYTLIHSTSVLAEALKLTDRG